MQDAEKLRHGRAWIQMILVAMQWTQQEGPWCVQSRSQRPSYVEQIYLLVFEYMGRGVKVAVQQSRPPLLRPPKQIYRGAFSRSQTAYIGGPIHVCCLGSTVRSPSMLSARYVAVLLEAHPCCQLSMWQYYQKPIHAVSSLCGSTIRSPSMLSARYVPVLSEGNLCCMLALGV